MLAGLDDGQVDHAIFIVRILRQGFEDALPHTGPAPGRMAQMHHAEVAKTFKRILLGEACPIAVQQALTKKRLSHAVTQI